MTRVTILPHPGLCPTGRALEIRPGRLLSDALLDAGLDIEHACAGACACSTCHVIIQQGFGSLKPASNEEEDRLEQAWGLTATSRLSCQVLVPQEPLVVELPRYSLNHAREEG